MTLKSIIESPFKHKLLFNGKHIGDAIQDVDGFYYFQPILESGLWAEYSLRMIADYLANVNEEWNNYLIEQFANEASYEEQTVVHFNGDGSMSFETE